MGSSILSSEQPIEKKKDISQRIPTLKDYSSKKINMNQYESRYVRGSTFLEEKTMDKECINKFWLTVNEAASKPYRPFSQDVIDEAKKRCHNMLNTNVPAFLPGNAKEITNTKMNRGDLIFIATVDSFKNSRSISGVGSGFLH